MGGRGTRSTTNATKNHRVTVYENALKSAESVSALELKSLETGNIAANIPGWILERNGIYGHAHSFAVERETDKAILVNDNKSRYGGQDTKFWVPKSQLQSVEKTRQEILEKTANQIVSQKYTNYLKHLASANNVKLGNISSWDKITARLKKKGVAVMSRDGFKFSKD